MFFILVFVLWAALNSYVFIRIWQALSIPPGFKIFYIAVAVLVALSMPLTMMLRENLSPGWSGTLQMISGTWMIILVYAALLFLFFDILRAVNYFVHFFPEVITGNYVLAKRILFSVGVLTVAIILAAGHWKFNHPQIARLELTTEKPLGPRWESGTDFF